MAAKGVATVGQAGNHREEVLQGEAFGYLQLDAINGRQDLGTVFAELLPGVHPDKGLPTSFLVEIGQSPISLSGDATIGMGDQLAFFVV